MPTARPRSKVHQYKPEGDTDKNKLILVAEFHRTVFRKPPIRCEKKWFPDFIEMPLQYYITTNTFSVNKPINMAIYVYESG